ncbi:hypothetical protein BDZ89DRAFT_1061952 [Hymenopellis radicata]|nr:hypothetical protein BDZ89DRAFT_1061952 [Hymenopellis radicata]
MDPSSAITIFDDDDLRQPNSEWKAAEWIGCNRSVHDVPPFVHLELEKTLALPPDIESLLPSLHQSPASFFSASRLPVWDSKLDSRDDPGALHFHNDQPTVTGLSQEAFTHLPIPSKLALRRLRSEVGQAWLDGKQSICDSRTQITVYWPLWGLSLFEEVHRVSKEYSDWGDAIAWLNSPTCDPAEENLRNTAMTLASSIGGWFGYAPEMGDMRYEFASTLLGDNYLNDAVLTTLLDILNKRLVSSRAAPDTLIAGTDFGRFIAQGCFENSSNSGRVLLDKYAQLFSPESPFRHLYLPVYSPPKHWSACHIDFGTGDVSFGDSLGRPRPKQFFKHLEEWLLKRTAVSSVQITETLPCAIQTDGFNCGIIAVNTIAHNILGEPLWSGQSANQLRIQAFCDVMLEIREHEDGPCSTAIDLEPDRNTALLQSIAVPQITIPETIAMEGVPVEERSLSKNAQISAKGLQEASDDEVAESEPPKRTKISTLHSKPADTTRIPPKADDYRKAKVAKAAAPPEKKAKAVSKLPPVAEQPIPSQKKFDNMMAKVRKPDAIADLTRPLASTCKQSIQLTGPYEVTRFIQHRQRDQCNPPKPTAPHPRLQTLDKFAITGVKPKPKPAPPTVHSKACPGKMHSRRAWR